MREATTQGMSLWIAPLILHAVIAVAITDLADIPFWFVLLAMMVARAYFGGVRLLGRTIAWYAYEKERTIRDIVEEFYTAKLPVARQAESYDAYFNRIADSSDIPAHVKRYAIRKLDYIWLLDTISLIDRWRQETVLKAAMSRYSAKKGQG
jgi:hypothetical protein